VLQQLNESGLTNNVAVIFTSFAAPEKFADPQLNFLRVNGSTRSGQNQLPAPLPMIMRWPGNILAGRVSDLPWSALDAAPTLLQMAQQPAATNYAGIFILQLLQNHAGTNTPALPADRNFNF